jgi:hypothetical protein
MPKVNSNRDKKVQANKRPMKVSGKSVFLLMILSGRPQSKKKGKGKK